MTVMIGGIWKAMIDFYAMTCVMSIVNNRQTG